MNFSDNEMQFAVLGPSGAGKTTLLACMSEEFEEELPGTIFPADHDTFSTLNREYKSLKSEANSSNREFERGVKSTENLREYLFNIKGRRAVLPVRFYDFPGGWMNPSRSESKMVIDIIKNSAVLIVAINTPYLIEFDGKYMDQGCPADEIEWVLLKGLEDNEDKERLILFVPIKCERYLETREERENLSRCVKNAFDKTLKLTSQPLYRDKLAMAMLPVQTVGNAKFRRFKFGSDDRVEREIYKKGLEGKSFCPQNVDQPMRYMMSFLLTQFAENKKKRAWWRKMWGTLFREGDLKEVAEYIRKGIKSDNDIESGFEIFCGRDLIGLPSRYQRA